MAVPLLERLPPVGVVDVRVRHPPGLAGVPLIPHLVCPVPRRGHERRARGGREDGAEVDEEVVGAEGVGGGVGIDGGDARGGVALVDDDARGGEGGALGDAAAEGVEDLLLRRHVVDLQAGGRDGADGVFRFAEEAGFARALDDGDGRVGDVALGVPDGVDGVEGGEESFGVGRGAAVGEGPADAGLRLGDAGVEVELAEVEGHVDGVGAVVVEGVEGVEDRFEVLPPPQIVVVVPRVGAPGEDVQFEAGDDPEVVARALQPPQEIAVAGFVDTNRSPVGQNEVELPDVVADHAVKALMASVASPETGTHHTDAIARTGGGNIALLPKVP